MKSPFHSHSGETALLKVESNPRVGRSSHQSYVHLLPGPTQRSMQLVPASSLRPFLPLATETSHSLLGIFPSQALLLSAFCHAPPHLPNVDHENTHGDQGHSPTGNHLGLSRTESTLEPSIRSRHRLAACLCHLTFQEVFVWRSGDQPAPPDVLSHHILQDPWESSGSHWQMKRLRIRLSFLCPRSHGLQCPL